MSSSSSIAGTIAALVELGNQTHQQITNYLANAHNPPPAISGVSATVSDLLSILRGFGNFNSIPSFPPAVAKNLPAVLDKCIKDLTHLQSIVHKLIDSKNGGSFAEKDLTETQDSLEVHKGMLEMTLSLANRSVTHLLHETPLRS
jgi:hypothetical protein